jgi:hypothetical protein
VWIAQSVTAVMRVDVKAGWLESTMRPHLTAAWKRLANEHKAHIFSKAVVESFNDVIVRVLPVVRAGEAMTRLGLAIATMVLTIAPTLALDGQPAMHDPSTVIAAGGKFYVYATGNGLPARVG